jgi:Tfp pilus assembly protein PilF
VTEQVAVQRAMAADTSTAYAPILERLAPLMQSVPQYGRASSLLCLVWTRYGMSLLAEGQDQAGVDALARAVETRPADAEANFQLGTALADRGRADRSLEFFERSLASRPGDAQARAHYGAALLAVGRLDEARDELMAAMAQRPHDAGPRHHLALVELQRGQLGDSEALFREALRLDPSRPGVHNSFAVLLAQTGRWAEAVALLEAGLALHPDDGHIQRQLAWLLATTPDDGLRDGDRAVVLAQSVNERTGGQVPQVLDTLAAALAESGRFEDAVELAEAAATRADEQGQADLADQSRERAALYRAQQPYRQPAS